MLRDTLASLIHPIGISEGLQRSPLTQHLTFDSVLHQDSVPREELKDNREELKGV